ncbi:MAG: hypothetical protein ACTSPD_02515 [Promethearchaeota archaeon]
MSFDFFDISEKEEEELEKKKPKKEKILKKEKIKEKCPYCGKSYININAHLKKCLENPNNIKKAKPKEIEKSIDFLDEGKLIEELREQFRKTITQKQKEDLILTVEEQEKIENVYKFLGGTEGYQFIYKTITGDKIRGSMPYIIDQCIEWLKKHRIYILHKKKWSVSNKSGK